MQQTCANEWCKTSFEISDEDLHFYDKISPVFNGKKYGIPPPTLCPDCRRQRRLMYRNERNLYHRSCDLCHKQIVSIYPEATPFPVYCNRCWWSDAWDPFSTGAAYDPRIPFLDQWIMLRDRTPQLAIQNDNTAGSENCEYCYDFAFGKNCYLTNCTWHIEEAYYCTNCNFTKFMVDCQMTNHDCELCYECIDCEKIYGCSYLQDSVNCMQCTFGYDLKGCRNCFGCFGLRHKESFSPEDFAKRTEGLMMGSYAATEHMKAEFAKWILQFPRQHAKMRQCENCRGNYIWNCKNVIGFDVFRSEECRYVDWTQDAKYCYDVHATGKPEWCLDCVTPDSSFRVLFSNWCWQCSDILYSDNCHSSTHLLGCTGLKHKKHCILNMEYSPQEYEKIAAEILEQLRRTNLWGNLFPLESSPFSYNETTAIEQYPLSKEEVLAKNWRWSDNLPFTTRTETMALTEIPDLIEECSDDILTAILACNTCARNYKIIAPEFSFYRKMRLPIPRLCPSCRYHERLAKRLPKKLWKRECAKCKKEIETSYQPSRPEIVYCEECYLAEVY